MVPTLTLSNASFVKIVRLPFFDKEELAVFICLVDLRKLFMEIENTFFPLWPNPLSTFWSASWRSLGWTEKCRTKSTSSLLSSSLLGLNYCYTQLYFPNGKWLNIKTIQYHALYRSQLYSFASPACTDYLGVLVRTVDVESYHLWSSVWKNGVLHHFLLQAQGPKYLQYATGT